MQGGTAPGKSGDIVAASATRGDERVGSDGLVHTMTENSSDEGTEEEGEAEEEPQLNMPVTIMLLGTLSLRFDTMQPRKRVPTVCCPL